MTVKKHPQVSSLNENARLRRRFLDGGEGGSGPSTDTNTAKHDLSPAIFLPGTPIQDMISITNYRQKQTLES